MELLMGGLKAAFHRKGSAEEQQDEDRPAGQPFTVESQDEEASEQAAGRRELAAMAVKVLAVFAISFAVARVPFFYVMYPCGIGLLTVLMARNRAGIYAVLPILAGLYSAEGLNAVFLGSMAAVLSCAALFFLLRKKEVSLTSRALLAAGICVIVKTTISIGLHTFYTYDGFSVLGEGLLVLFFTLLGAGVLSLAEKENPEQSVSANIFIMTISGLLLIGGTLPQMIGAVTPLNVAALCLVLLIGYRLGVMEGAVTGVAAGMMLFGAANQGPAIMGILACGGMAAGLLRGEKRMYASVCFCAVCLSFGFLKGYPNLYMLAYEPMLASLVFLAVPAGLLAKVDKLLAKAGRDEASYELLEKKRILSSMEEYRETFSYLALVYGPGKDGRRIPRREGADCGDRQERSGRSVASYQFAAIACALDDMMKELRHVERPVLVREERFRVRIGSAGYARCEGISGDSTLCNHLKKGAYLIALADGMGKGERAAQESSLTLNTLYNLMRAGFEPELALRMINSLLLMKSTEEIFSTLDMGLINLFTGQLCLYKIGAATTFIKRGDKVEAIKASSLPLGMVEKFSVDSIQVRLRRGDQIIIVSDGITEADRGKIRPVEALSFFERHFTNEETVLQKTGTEPLPESPQSQLQPQSQPPTEQLKAQLEPDDLDWSRIGAAMARGAAERRGLEPAQLDWTLRVEEENRQQGELCGMTEEKRAAAAALAERVRMRTHCARRAAVETPPVQSERRDGDIHEEWLKETIAQIKSTDPQTISDLILNKAVERCGLREKDDMTVITAYIS